MQIDHCEEDRGARACWHQCPLCGKIRLLSQPATDLSAGSATSAYADPPETAHPEPMLGP